MDRGLPGDRAGAAGTLVLARSGQKLGALGVRQGDPKKVIAALKLLAAAKPFKLRLTIERKGRLRMFGSGAATADPVTGQEDLASGHPRIYGQQVQRVASEEGYDDKVSFHASS